MPNTTDSSPSPQRIRYHDPDWKVAPTVDDIASACGVSPDLSGLIMTSVIGGLNRRDRAAFRNIVGSIPTGPSLLIIGADRNPRLRRLLSMLLQPLTMKQDLFRDSVGACRKDRLDLLQFGPGLDGNSIDPTFQILERIKEGPFSDDSLGLGMGWNENRELVAANRPTIFLSNPTPDTLLTGLEEATDGQLLVTDEQGDLFQLLAAPSRANRPKIDRIKALLGQYGADDTFEKANLRQGPGTLENRRLSMISLVSREQLISLVRQKNDGLSCLLRRFFVVDAEAFRTDSIPLPTSRNLSAALNSWERALASTYHSRLFGKNAGPVPPEDISDHLMHVMADYQNALDGMDNECHFPLGHLWAVPLQLYSALAVVSRTGTNGQAHVLPMLDGLSQRIAKGHLSALTRLQDEVAGNEVLHRREAILRAIGRHGPCSFRVIIRTFSVQRKDLYEPLVCELIEEGEVVETDDGMLALPAGCRSNLEAQERRLN